MPHIEVAEFFIPNAAIDKLWSHGRVPDQVHALLNGHAVVKRNRRGRAAPYIFIGRDEQGQCLTIPIGPTHDRLIWRVVTGWRCKPHEVAMLRQGRSVMEALAPYGSTQEPLDDEERELMDPDNWDWDDSIEVIISEYPRVSFEIAVTFEEHKRVAEAARSQGLDTAAFIKQAALDAAGSMPTNTALNPTNRLTRERRSG